MKYFLIISILITLVSCSEMSEDEDNVHLVRIIYTEEITSFCSKGLACYNSAKNTIYTPPIRGDWDRGRLLLLGEEMWHKTGGHH